MTTKKTMMGRHAIALTRTAVCSALLALSAGAHAQRADHVLELGTLSINELMELEVDSVYGASRYVQKSSRAPSSVTVITADDIATYGARTLGDVLNSVRGLFVANDRNYVYLGIRGFQRPNDYNTRVLVLIDGHRMNDNIYDLGAVGREGMIDVELIDRVEVIRGPSSSVYGSSAFLGVINVITKHADGFDGVEASGEAGTFDSYKSRVTYGETFANGVEWLISASHFSSAGQPQLYYPELDQRISGHWAARNNGVAQNLDGEDADNFFTSVRFGDFAVSAFMADRDKIVPTASFGTLFNDPNEQTNDTRTYLDVKYDRRFGDSLWLQARVFYDEYVYSGTYPYDFAESGLERDFVEPGLDPNVVLFKDKTVGRWVGTEWQLTAQLPERHTVVVGGEYRDNLREQQIGYYDIQPIELLLNDDRTSDVFGLFAQSETRLRANLSFTAGVRYDSYSGDIGDTLNPRLGLIYNPSATGTVKALYGEAFRAPNPYERYYYWEQPQHNTLDPETIRTYELVYEKQLASEYRLTVSGYDYVVDNLISQNVTDSGELFFDNVDGARARGIEIEVDRRFESGISFRASYARQHAEDALTGEELTTSPEHLTKANLSVPFHGDKLLAGFELQHQSDVRTLLGDRTDDFVTANVSLSKRVAARGLELSASLYNIFDERYAYPGAKDHFQDMIEQDGRTFLGKLTYRF